MISYIEFLFKTGLTVPLLYCIIDSILILSTFTLQISLLGVTFNFSTVEFIQLLFKIAK